MSHCCESVVDWYNTSFSNWACVRLLNPVTSVNNWIGVERLTLAFIAVDHVLLDDHRPPIDGCKGLCLAPCVPYVIGIFASRTRVGPYSQDMTREEVLIPDKLCILRPGFPILGVEKGVCIRYEYDLYIALAVPVLDDRLL